MLIASQSQLKLSCFTVYNQVGSDRVDGLVGSMVGSGRWSGRVGSMVQQGRIRAMVDNGRPGSAVFFGPAGSGRLNFGRPMVDQWSTNAGSSANTTTDLTKLNVFLNFSRIVASSNTETMNTLSTISICLSMRSVFLHSILFYRLWLPRTSHGYQYLLSPSFLFN